MVTPAANPDHAKAAPEGWQRKAGRQSPRRQWRHRRPIPITPKPHRKTGRQSRPTSMAAPAVNLPASISPHQSRAGQPGGISSPWRRWRHQRPISEHQYRHAKAAPGNRAALPRPGVDGGTGGQFRPHQSCAKSEPELIKQHPLTMIMFYNNKIDYCCRNDT